MANGCIREKQPGCPMQAAIPSVTVESIEGIKNLADCLVHVSDINTTFYIDDKHRPIITWAGPIDIPGYDMEGNPNNYRDQIVTDVANQIAVIYDKSGKGYVFGLVENIDLQEQVNNKLDEMAEDGTLANLLNNYVDGFLYPEVKVETKRDNTTKTTYYVATIPHLDDSGEAIVPKMGFAEDAVSNPQDTETVRSFSTRHNSTLATNASYFSVDSSSPIYHKPLGIGIHNGTVIYDNSAFMPSFAVDKNQYFAIKEDGTFTHYAQDYSSQQMLDDGVVEAFLGQIPIVENGENYMVTHPDLPTPVGFDVKDQYTVWGQTADKDTVVLVCNGDGLSREQGLTLTQIANILIEDYNVDFAMSLDSGGSSQFVYKDYLMNFPGDLFYTEERKVPTYLYIGKDAELNHYQKLESQTNAIEGEAKFEADNKVDFKSGFIRLTNTKNLFSPGIESYLDNCRNKLTLGNDTLEFVHHNEDDTEVTTVFRAKPDGLLETILGVHAYIPHTLSVIDNSSEITLSDIKKTTFSYVPNSTAEWANGDEPFTNSYAIVITVGYQGQYASQIAFPVGSGAETNDILQRRFDVETGWNEWKKYNYGDTTDWTPLTTTKGTVKYRKKNGIVEIRGTVNSGQSGVIVESVPASIIPSEMVFATGYGSGSNMVKVFLNPLNSQLSMVAPAVAANYSFNFTYTI